MTDGCVQWMTAGRGIVHSEMPGNGGSNKIVHSEMPDNGGSYMYRLYTVRCQINGCSSKYCTQ